MTAHLGINELTVEFESSGYMVRPLDGLSFTATDGELVVLLGPSGCGKTTLISCMAALLTPESGRIVFSGQTVNELRGADLALYRQRTVGVVFQAFNLIPSLSARSNVMVPLRLAGVSRAQARERADALLDRVGLTERAHHRPAQLSGGQQQRVAIARALVQNPPLVVADEPTAHLDHIQVEGVLKLLRELAAPGRIVVVATHDDRVTHIADRVVELVPHFVNADRAPEDSILEVGELLFQQGERGELIYFIESGRLEVFRIRADGTEEHLAEVGAGNYVGGAWSHFLRPTPKRSSVRAIEKVTAEGIYRVDVSAPVSGTRCRGKLSQRPAASMRGRGRPGGTGHYRPSRVGFAGADGRGTPKSNGVLLGAGVTQPTCRSNQMTTPYVRVICQIILIHRCASSESRSEEANSGRVREFQISLTHRRGSAAREEGVPTSSVKTGPPALVPFVVVTLTKYVPAGAVVGEIAVIVVDPTTAMPRSP